MLRRTTHTSLTKDGYCDSAKPYNSIWCFWDEGDCNVYKIIIKMGDDLEDLYLECQVHNPEMVNVLNCDSGLYNTE